MKSSQHNLIVAPFNKNYQRQVTNMSNIGKEGAAKGQKMYMVPTLKSMAQSKFSQGITDAFKK